MFTALNAAENFDIVYFTDEGETNERGRIECFGYLFPRSVTSNLHSFRSCRVESFTPEEVESFGQHGFKVVPYLDSNRTWHICAESEESKLEWQAVFS